MSDATAHTATNATSLTHHSHVTHNDRMTHLWTKSRLEHARISWQTSAHHCSFCTMSLMHLSAGALNKRANGLRVHRSVAPMPSVHTDRTSAPQWQRSWIWRGSLNSELLEDNPLTRLIAVITSAQHGGSERVNAHPAVGWRPRVQARGPCSQQWR